MANDPNVQKILVIELFFENMLHLADWIPAVTIYCKYLRQNLTAMPYLTFQKPPQSTVLYPITGNFKAS